MIDFNILRDWQKSAYLKWVDKGIFLGCTGCLSGDTKIKISRKKNTRTDTLEHWYEKMNGIKRGKGRHFDISSSVYIRSFNGKEIRLHKINGISYSGKKEVYRLRLKNGFSLKATIDHKIMTRGGWVELSNLKKCDLVMCDTLNTEARNRKRIKLPDIGLGVGKNHPYNTSPNRQIGVHRLIYEAYINKLHFTEYLDILLNDHEKCKALKFINPSIYHIHHKDGNHYNNSIENLEKLKVKYHKLVHNNYSNFTQGIPKFSEVDSIEFIGKEDTYDISCEEPYHNFVANNIVVHNSGKSLAAMYCIQERNVNTLIVVPTIALMNQWVEELRINFGTDIGMLGDNQNRIEKITVAVVNSVRSKDLSYFDMIVLDEVHRYGSIENIRPLLQNEFKYKLGLTATLKRSDGEDKKLTDLIGPVVYEYTTEDAVKQGILSKFEIINIGVDLNELERQKYNKYTEIVNRDGFQGMFQVVYNQGHPMWHKAVSAVRNTTWRKAVISNAKNKMKTLIEIVKKEKDKKIIIFNETIKMAELERKLLKKEGFHSEIYHSKKKNQEAIEKFKSGEVNILVSVKSLNEGLDVKDVDIGIRVAGTNQDRDTIQRLGRSLRIVEGKQSKYYQIYCKDTIEKWQITKNTNVIKSASEKVTWL